MRKLLFGILFMSIFQFSYSQREFKTQNKKVDSLIRLKMQELEIPSLAVAIIRDGKILKKSVYGFANIEWKRNATEHSNFQIASCTKLLTSTLLLKTIYNHKIDLNESVDKYLDSIPNEWKKIKIKNLISHSSGLPEFYESDTYLPTYKIVNLLKTKPLIFETGTKEQYGQSDFMLLSYIFEKIYKKPFVEILRAEVIIPLDMIDGNYDMEFKIKGQFLRTQLIKEKVTTYYEIDNKIFNYKFLYPQYTYPAGGYFASIDDMANWAIGLDKNKLFPLDFANDLIYKSDKILDKDAEFSKVGWAIQKEKNITYAGHSGGPGLGDIWRFPKEKITIIVLSNDGELLPNFSRAIASWYIEDLSPNFTIEKFER